MIYEEKFSGLAEDLSSKKSTEGALKIYRQPDFLQIWRDHGTKPSPQSAPLWQSEGTETAFIHHSSGTSGSLPKPLHVSQTLAVGALPVPHGRNRRLATFSTTPLYHGGTADCLRSWTAASMIWLFPGDVPVTAANVLSCVRTASKAVSQDDVPPVGFFSCVPQILNFVADSAEGMKILHSMQMVGVGGAPMPKELAARLVEAGVNLLSRLGSTECGFLLTSHRNFANDKEWQYLRQGIGWPMQFEPRDNGLSELVVLPTWPGLGHHNRPDGAFATADLFEPHPTIPRAWKYHSRADAQLTLSTGKKFDPIPLEDAIRESSLLGDILVFGSDQPYPGALLFRSSSSKDMDGQQLLNEIWPFVQSKNDQSPPHARLARSMLVVMPASAPGLEKSIKHTTLRKKAQIAYEKDIGDAYANEATQDEGSNTDSFKQFISDQEVAGVVRQLIKETLPSIHELKDEDDFFDLGIDSNAAIRLRARIQKLLIPQDRAQLPLNVIYDSGNLSRLTQFLIAFRNGNKFQSNANEEELRLMRDLVARYTPKRESDDQSRSLENDVSFTSDTPQVVLLTGVTGTLGAHIFSQLQAAAVKSEIHCLIRASSKEAAINRAKKALSQRHLPSFDSSLDSVHFHPCKLSDGFLGLGQELFEDLAGRVTLIIHAAWAVNFTMRLASFEIDHIKGLYNLLEFAIQPHADSKFLRFVFCSSTASVLGPNLDVDTIQEQISEDPHAPMALGYSRSKWVAEAICAETYRERLKGRLKVVRIGQLCGDTQRGVWNVTEAWPLMLSSSQVTGCLPDLGREKLAWLPVDTAAQAVLEIAFSPQKDDSPEECPIYHLVNSSNRTTWADLLGWLGKLSPAVEVISPREWVSRLEQLDREGQQQQQQHPALKLLDLWRRNYVDGDSNHSPEAAPPVIFDMTSTCLESPTMRDVPAIGEEHFRKIWDWLQGEEMLQRD